MLVILMVLFLISLFRKGEFFFSSVNSVMVCWVWVRVI